jgi:hypothetical protein
MLLAKLVSTERPCGLNGKDLHSILVCLFFCYSCDPVEFMEINLNLEEVY